MGHGAGGQCLTRHLLNSLQNADKVEGVACHKKLLTTAQFVCVCEWLGIPLDFHFSFFSLFFELNSLPKLEAEPPILVL